MNTQEQLELQSEENARYDFIAILKEEHRDRCDELEPIDMDVWRANQEILNSSTNSFELPGWGVAQMRFACREVGKDISDEDATKLLRFVAEQAGGEVDYELIWDCAGKLGAQGKIKFYNFAGVAVLDECGKGCGPEWKIYDENGVEIGEMSF